MPDLRARFDMLRYGPAGQGSLAGRLILDDHGTLSDYHALAVHHYRAGKPATATRVLVLRDPAPGLALRAERIGLSIFASGDESTKRPEKPKSKPSIAGVPAAVLVESLPSLSCRMRDHALRGRYGTHLAMGPRAALLNGEVRCISRVVVEPRWRGLGLAVRLVRRALATATTPVTEALAAMGHVSPFFERAGMTAYPRPTHPYDDRLKAALAHAGIDPTLPNPDTAAKTIAELTPTTRAWLTKELRQWHAKNGGRRRHAVAGCNGLPGILRTAQQRLHSEPVYYVAVRSDG